VHTPSFTKKNDFFVMHKKDEDKEISHQELLLAPNFFFFT
jgi:hypothetical protein